MQKFIPAMADLHKKTFPPGWPEDDFALHIKSQNDLVYVLGQADNLIGFIIGRLAGEQVEILTLAVGEQYKRQGYGTKLLDMLQNGAQEKNARSIILEVAKNNIAAKKLYEKHGFLPFGLRKNYYPAFVSTNHSAQAGHERIDAIVYQKYLA